MKVRFNATILVKRIALFLSIILILVAILIGLATWRFSQWVVPQLQSYLVPYGINDLKTSDPEWRWNNLRFERIDIAGYSTAYSYETTLRNVDVSYRWSEIFAGRLSRIAISQLEGQIILPHSQVAPVPHEDKDRFVTSFLPAAWIVRLPLDQLQINSVQFEITGTSLFEPLQVQGSGITVDNPASELRGMFTIRQAGAIESLIVSLGSSPDNPLSANILWQQNSQQVVSADMSLLSTQNMTDFIIVKARVSAELGLLQQSAMSHRQLLADDVFAQLNKLPNISGKSEFVAELKIPTRMNTNTVKWLKHTEITAQSRHELTVAEWPEYGLSTVDVALAHTAIRSESGWVLRFTEPISFKAKIMAEEFPVLAEKLGWSTLVPLTIQATTEHELVFQHDNVSWESGQIKLVAGNDESRLNVAGFLKQVSITPQTAIATLLAQVNSKWRKKTLPTIQIDANLEQGANGWRGKGKLRQNDFGLNGSWQANLRQATSELQASANLSVSNLPNLLTRIGKLSSLPVDIALVSGELGVDYTVNTRFNSSPSPQAEQQFQFAAKGITGLVEGMALRQVSINGAFSRNKQWRGQVPVTINIATLDTGIALSNITLTAELGATSDFATSQWLVSRANADILGGKVSLAEPFTFTWSAPANRFDLLLSNWQLADMLALYQQEDLNGTGVLSGRLPIQVNLNGAAVTGGRLDSQPPGGVIRYYTGLGKQGSMAGTEQLGLALRLLEHFEYDQLKSTINFSKDGELALQLSLWGHNPNEFNGRTVNFNINIEENIFELLETLRLTDDLINNLEKRLQR